MGFAKGYGNTIKSKVLAETDTMVYNDDLDGPGPEVEMICV